MKKKTAPRYVVVDGVRKRNPAAMRDDVLAFLNKHAGVTRTVIAEALRAGGDVVQDVLDGLARDHLAESFKARTAVRNRVDVYWYRAGRAPQRPEISYRAAETLQAFQIAARAQLRGEVRV